MLYIVMCRDLETGGDKEVPHFHPSMKHLTEELAWKFARLCEQKLYEKGIRQPFWATPVLDT